VGGWPRRPDLQRQSLIIDALADARGFDPVIGLEDGRVGRIEGDVIDTQGLVEILVGRDIAAAVADDHLDLEPAVRVEGGDMNVLLQDLDIRVVGDVGRRRLARPSWRGSSGGFSLEFERVLSG
jgi:hypothetical protein